MIFLFLLVPGSSSGASFLSFLSSGMGRPMNSLLHMNVVETWFVAVWGLCWCNFVLLFYLFFFLRLSASNFVLPKACRLSVWTRGSGRLQARHRVIADYQNEVHHQPTSTRESNRTKTKRREITMRHHATLCITIATASSTLCGVHLVYMSWPCLLSSHDTTPTGLALMNIQNRTVCTLLCPPSLFIHLY